MWWLLLIFLLALAIWWFGSQCSACEGFLNFNFLRWPRCTSQGCRHPGLSPRDNPLNVWQDNYHLVPMRHYATRPIATRAAGRRAHW